MIERTDGARSYAVPVGIACLLVYAAPLFYPPASAPLGTVPGPDAWLLQRIFPSVPATWVLVRLVALAAAAFLLTGQAGGLDVVVPCSDAPVRRDRRDRKSTRLNSSHIQKSRMPSSA